MIEPFPPLPACAEVGMGYHTLSTNHCQPPMKARTKRRTAPSRFSLAQQDPADHRQRRDRANAETDDGREEANLVTAPPLDKAA